MLCWSQNLVSNERNASTRKLNSDFIELKFRLPLSHLRLHMLLNQQEKKVVTILIGAMGHSILITKGKLGCYCKMEMSTIQYTKSVRKFGTIMPYG